MEPTFGTVVINFHSMNTLETFMNTCTITKKIKAS